MRVAITAQQGDMDALVGPRFGHSTWMIFADTESGKWTAVAKSESTGEGDGAGVKAADEVLSQGTEALITGHIGPAAQCRLAEAGVPIYHAGNGVTVRDALARLATHGLEAVEAPTVAGHWSLPAVKRQPGGSR